MIAPSVGRIVWYYPAPTNLFEFAIFGEQPLAAQIAFVYNARHVNLSVTDHAGFTRAVRDVPLLQNDDPRPMNAHFCEWMPFQRGEKPA